MALPSIKIEEDSKRTPEDAFREICEDCARLIKGLTPVCTSLDDALGMLTLATGNDGQLKLLMALMDRK